MEAKVKKSMAVTTTLFVVLLAFWFCGKPKHVESTEGGQNSQSSTVNTTSERDAKFLAKAMELSLAQVEFGDLATHNSSNIKIKELGGLMERTFTEAMIVLKNKATKRGLDVPRYFTGQSKDRYYKMHTKTDLEFDKLFCDALINTNTDAVILFESAGNECTDPEIRSWALATLPVLKDLLDHSYTCTEMCKMEELNKATVKN